VELADTDRRNDKESQMAVATLPIVPTPTVAETGDRMDTLRSRLRGRLITAGDAGYDDARRVLYFNVDRNPLAIVRAADARDVATVVNFARDNSLPLAVRSGGHSLAYLSVIDDAIVIDL
jgi:hypothetical protein